MEELKKYPTEADKEGFCYLSQEEELLKIESKAFENGNQVKRVTLSDGSVAIVRQLKGRDTVAAKRLENGELGIDLDTASISIAIAFDGKKRPPEFYLDELFQMDYIRLNGACSQLNFQ